MTQIRVAFDQHVLHAVVDDTGVNTVVTLTFTGGAIDPSLLANRSLADGRYTLTILAGQVSSGGPALDGNDDRTGGDNFVFADSGTTIGNQLFRLFGDATGDHVVNAADLTLLRPAFGSTIAGPTFDWNGDGVTSAADLNSFRTNFGAAV